jgi:hypothetical protein
MNPNRSMDESVQNELAHKDPLCHHVTLESFYVQNEIHTRYL